MIDLSTIAEALESGDIERRRAGVEALAAGWHRSDLATSLLIRAMGDDDWRVRRDASALGERVADVELTDVLLDGLRQGDNVGLRNASIEVIRAMGARSAPAVTTALATADAPVRKFLLEALGGPGTTEAALAAAACVDDEDENLSAAALEALARIGGPHAERVLRDALANGPPFQRVSALAGLAAMDAAVPFPELEDASRDRITWRSTIPLMARTGDPRALEVLSRGLTTGGEVATDAAAAMATLSDAIAREAIAEALDDFGARETLRQLLAEGSRHARQASGTLALIARDPSLMAGVIDLMATDGITRSGARALRAWGDGAVVAALDTMADLRPDRASVALELAGELASDPATCATVRSAALDAVDEPDEVLVGAGLAALGHVARAEDAEALAGQALSRDGELGLLAAKSLEALTLRAPVQVAEVLRSLRLESGTALLVRALVSARGSDAFDQLEQGLASDDVALRGACAVALGAPPLSVRGEAVVRLLHFCLSDDEPSVRRAAAESIEAMRERGVHAAEDPKLGDAARAALAEHAPRSRPPRA